LNLAPKIFIQDIQEGLFRKNLLNGIGTRKEQFQNPIVRPLHDTDHDDGNAACRLVLQKMEDVVSFLFRKEGIHHDDVRPFDKKLVNGFRHGIGRYQRYGRAVCVHLQGIRNGRITGNG